MCTTEILEPGQDRNIAALTVHFRVCFFYGGYMDIAIIERELDKLINKALKYDEVPVAALIVKNNKIIAKGYNKVNKKNNFMMHAEIIAIKKAIKKEKNWRLNDCELYITLEPCSMCREIIKKARIKDVYYFSKQNNYKTESDPTYNYINNDNFSKRLSTFFKNKR